MIVYSSEIAVKQAQFNKAQHETQSIAINNKQYSDYEQRGYYTWEQAGKNAVQTDLNKNDTKTISALIKELSVASDDRLLEIASQFQGLQNADGSFNTNVNAIESYLAMHEQGLTKKDEEYDTGIYVKRKANIITYETTDFKPTQKVEYLATKQEGQKIKNQILSDKFIKT